jgi:uncharacterized damage-inducible protein DinB
MGEVSALETLRALYDYHWWANHRLFDVAVALGDEAAQRELGKHFSFPTLKATFAHIYGADFVWLMRWKGQMLERMPGDADVPSLAVLRSKWDDLEKSQREFIDGLRANDLGRIVEFRSVAYPRPDGGAYRIPLWPLLQHVPNHATHHRSEIATMITMISGSPPATDLALYYFRTQGFAG